MNTPTEPAGYPVLRVGGAMTDRLWRPQRPEEIERIVREVMAQLGVASKTVAAAPAAPADAPLAVPPALGDGHLFVDSRVVTLESIAGRLQGTKQLMVLPAALVTPSVRDELRRKGVALVRGSGAARVRKELPRLLLVVGRSRHDPAAAVEMLTREGIGVQTETSDCMIAATDKLAAAVARGQSLGLLWTRHTAVGLCLANRHAGVRAVLATSVAATAAAISALGANVLVVDPAAGTAYEKKQILCDFCLGGIRDCPEELKERLEYSTRVLSTEYSVLSTWSTMRIADVIGTVTLNRATPASSGATWKLVVPLSWDNLLGKSDEPVEEVVVLDELGAGLGSRIALSEGREAAMPFFPAVKPIDAYNAAILDTFQVEIPKT